MESPEQNKRLLNIQKDYGMEPLQASQLFQSAKACFVLARFSLEMFMDFRVPGFILMHQALENLIKSLLKENKTPWTVGKKGHDFIKLLNLGQKNIPLFHIIISRLDFCSLLNQLQEGYTAQKYGEAGHFVNGYEEMMNLFDELFFLLVEEYGKQSGLKNDKLERLVALPVPPAFEVIFSKNLKQPFIFCDIYI